MKTVAGLVLILVGGIVALPLATLLFDAEGSENWIAPVAVVLAAAVGGTVNALLPVLSPEHPTALRVIRGAALGLAALAIGIVLFWVLLSGLRGA